ncbi:MAG: DUF2148 domain-containing protein [Desulfurococcaceae archaeon]
MIEERDAITRSVLIVAQLMVLSAKTAPKARGVDNIVATILSDKDEIEKLAGKMEELASLHGDFFKRDAISVKNSDAVVLIGCKIVRYGLSGPITHGLDPDIVNSIVNLGIALGSAVKTASIHNVDNRIMYSIGVAAKELNLLDADIIYGIPLSARSKNIYFDRIWPLR